jgi:hypothetical protein|tara:strand:- start:383 stop:667 length:285 start_codon:yes stop_codon:yes gene_type:complete
MEKDRDYLHVMYNATSEDDGSGDIETYEFWLEKQLLSRIEEMEKELFLFQVRYAMNGNVTQLVKAKNVDTALEIMKQSYPIEDGYSYKLTLTLE